MLYCSELKYEIIIGLVAINVGFLSKKLKNTIFININSLIVTGLGFG